MNERRETFLPSVRDQLIAKLNEREGMFPQIDGTPQYQDKYEQAKHEQRKRRREELLRKWPVQEDWPVCPSDEAPMEESNDG